MNKKSGKEHPEALNIDQLEFTDIFDLAELQRLQDLFAETQGVASLITRPDGTPITAPSNFTRLCKNIIRETEKGCANCIKSDAIIGHLNPTGPTIQACHSGGLWDASASIVVDNKHIANWLIGQVRSKELDMAQIISYADEIGANKEEFKEALSEVPQMPVETFKKVANLLFTFANELSEKAYNNLRLKQLIYQQKKATEEIEKNKEFLSTTLHSIGDGVITTDINGYVLNMNPVAEHLCGWKLKEASGRLLNEIFTIVNSRTKEPVADPVQKAIKSGQIIGLANDTLLISKNGQEYQIADSAAPIKDKEGNIEGVVLVFSDVTEKYKAEQTIRQSEKQFRSLFENMKEGAALHSLTYDKNGNPYDYIIIDTNQSFEKQLGIKRNLVIDKTSREAYGVSTPPFFDIYKKVALTGVSSSFEDYYAPLKKHFSISVYQTFNGGFATIFEDITQKKIAERQLKNSEQQWRRAIADSPFPIMIHDENDQIIQLSEGWTKFSGYTIEDIPTLADWTEKAYGERTGLKKDYIDRLFSIGETVKNGEWAIITKDGTKRIWDFQTTPLGTTSDGLRILHSQAVDITDHKNAEDILKVNLTKYQVLFDSFPVGVTVSDSDGKIIETNSIARELLGISNEEQKKRKISGKEWQIITEDGSPMPADAFPSVRALKEGKTITDVTLGIIKSRHKISWLNVSATPIPLEGYGVIISYNDITEKKRYEENLRQEQYINKTLIDSLPGIFYVYSYPEMQLIKWNKNHETIFGYNAEELRNMNIEKWHRPEAKELVYNAMQRVIDKGFETIETPLYTKDGKAIPFILSGVKLELGGKNHIMGVGFDIVERKKNEETLRETNDYLENLINYANAPIIVWDPQFRITRFNQAFEHLTGLSEAEVKGSSLEILFPRDMIEKSMALIRKTVTGERWEAVEIQIQQKNKSIRTILWNSATIFAHDGVTPIATVAQGQDITYRKNSEIEIKQKNEELQKMNIEKDKFFSIIAHDLRSPFNGFLGLTRQMSEGLSSMNIQQLHEIVDRLRSSATNLFSLLENLLQWSRLQQGLIPFNPVKVPLITIVKESIEVLLEPSKSKGLEIRIQIPDDYKIIADSNMIQTVIRNLVSNAIKFTPKGGNIEITALQSENNESIISVSDNGIGMSHEILDNLFSIGKKINRKGTEGEPSTGLGLIICKDFIKKHGGHIQVNSLPGKGSTFTISLPFSEVSEHKTSASASNTINSLTTNSLKLTVLIVEDDEISEKLLTSFIHKISQRIFYAKTGTEAVEICRNNPEIELILMDIRMTDMNGYEATKEIRQFNNRIVIIAQSAYALAQDKEIALQNGCNDYIAKPIEKDKLLAMIEKHMNKKIID